MKKWECIGCEKRHKAESEEKPIFCLFNFDHSRWCEISDDKLPKLTVKELEKREIGWPEWAKYAAVTSYGSADFFGTEPQKNIITFCPEAGSWHCGIPGEWDASDWKNSLIERPEKQAIIPNWCKAGAWCWYIGHGYGNITKTNPDGDFIVDFITAGKVVVSVNYISEARVHQWTPAEAMHNLGYEFSIYHEKGIIWAIGNGFIIDNGKRSIMFDALAKNGVLKGGFPCGTLEHLENGVWVK